MGKKVMLRGCVSNNTPRRSESNPHLSKAISAHVASQVYPKLHSPTPPPHTQTHESLDFSKDVNVSGGFQFRPLRHPMEYVHHSIERGYGCFCCDCCFGCVFRHLRPWAREIRLKSGLVRRGVGAHTKIPHVALMGRWCRRLR